MKTIEVKRQLLEEALDQLKGAQQDCYVLSTQNVIDELEVVLRQSDVIKSVCEQCGMEHKLTTCSECYQGALDLSPM